MSELLKTTLRKLFLERYGQFRRHLQRRLGSEDLANDALHETVEDALLRAAYEFCHHNQVHTAKLLGLSRNVTRTRLIKLGALTVTTRRLETGTGV